MLQYQLQSFIAPDRPSTSHKRHHQLFGTRPLTPVSQPDSALSINTDIPPSPISPSSPAQLPQRSPYLHTRRTTSPASPTGPWSALSLNPDQDGSPSPNHSGLENVLLPGDIVSENKFLQGELIRPVPVEGGSAESLDHVEQFEVIRPWGTGSYAVVYLAREILSPPQISEDGHASVLGAMEFDGVSSPQPVRYGREYAIKCLSKVNLKDNEELLAQMEEVKVHQSLRPHPNIVTLHRTLETSSYLLLILEFVPGEDLFYFLQQSRDHCSPSSDMSLPCSLTPPTPSLLSNLNPSQLLSRTRLRLIASMFAQMCEAVAACHDQLVFHRDIKPENFIVTDAWTESGDDTRRERRVVVKLSDFGLSTRDVDSPDIACGSAPYMSYECRNNLGPTYRTRAADVWSLGVVLINMLYHSNPWQDTNNDASFDNFQQQPVGFFMQRCPGMTRPVAEFLANKVFCILEDNDDSPRIGAREFGTWAKNLPALLGDQPGQTAHSRINSSSSIQVPITCPPSRRPSLRNASKPGTPALGTRTLSSAPSHLDVSELSTVIDQEVEERDEQERQQMARDGVEANAGAETEGTGEADVQVEIEMDGMNSRATSNQRHRKRGTRKGKGTVTPSLTPSPTLIPSDEMIILLADETQSLAREVSKTSRTSSRKTTASRTSSRAPREPKGSSSQPNNVKPSDTLAVPHLPVKKPSLWKLPFGKNSGGLVSPPLDDGVAPTSHTPAPTPPNHHYHRPAHVTTLIMGLNATLPPPAPRPPNTDGQGRGKHQPSARGRNGYRNPSPNSTRNGGRTTVASSASSTHSGNWRSSMSSAGTSTSAFTHYNNSSVSTVATSVSSHSWRKQALSSSASTVKQLPIPKTVKNMEGVPQELDELPGGQHSNSTSDVFGSPPTRKARTRKVKDPSQLEPITERPGTSSKSTDSQRQDKSAESQRQDASTSTTDLHVNGSGKAQKGQITTLGKMLSALRR